MRLIILYGYIPKTIILSCLQIWYFKIVLYLFIQRTLNLSATQNLIIRCSRLANIKCDNAALRWSLARLSACEHSGLSMQPITKKIYSLSFDLVVVKGLA